MSAIRGLAFICLTALALAACRQEIVYEAKDHPVPQVAQKALNDEQLEKLIIQATLVKNWRVDVVRPGQLRAPLRLRDKHTAVSDIFFFRQSFSILLTSHNLKQDETGHIHRSYNQAVRALEDEIDRSLYRSAY